MDLEFFHRQLALTKTKIQNSSLAEALKILNHLKQQFPKQPEIYFELGKLHYLQGKLKQSEIFLKTFLTFEPQNVHALDFLAQIAQKQNNLKKALKYLLQLKRISADVNTFNKKIINLFLHFRRVDLAVKYNPHDNTLKKLLLTTVMQNLQCKNNQNKIFSAERAAKICSSDRKYKNIFLSFAEYQNKKIKLTTMPSRLSVALTNTCNLKCLMCFNITERNNTLSQKAINKIIKLYPYLNFIDWLGGEIFLHKQFDKLFLLAKKQNIQQAITTNALLITKSTAKMLVRGTHQLNINISIDSPFKTTYENIRRGANFDKLISNLKMLNAEIEKAKNPDITMSLNIVVSSYNIHENYTHILHFAKQYKFSSVCFLFDIQKNPQEISAQFYKQKKEIVCVAKRLGLALSIQVPDFKQKTAKKATVKNCPFLYRSLYIHYDGNVRMHCNCNEVIGNIYYKNVKDIYNSPKALNLRKAINSRHGYECNIGCAQTSFLDNFFQSNSY
jgi:MoaA/NifB/PqqE/SkfB family radical SAM enzyme